MVGFCGFCGVFVVGIFNVSALFRLLPRLAAFDDVLDMYITHDVPLGFHPNTLSSKAPPSLERLNSAPCAEGRRARETTSVRGPCSNQERRKHNVQPTNHLQPCTEILRSHCVLCQLGAMEGRCQPLDVVLGLMHDPAASPVCV